MHMVGVATRNCREIAMHRLMMTLTLFMLMVWPAAAADDVPDATIELAGGSVAAGIGYTWGRGRLIYHGRLFRLKVNGLSIADVGISSYTASGDVYNLKKPTDILGTYTGVTAGAAAGGGFSATAMRNERGVTIRMTALRSGLALTLAPGGMTITGAR
jgi:hypothetical protein